MKVYLAGPMSGLSVKDADGWRDYISRTLVDQDIEVFNPVNTVKPHLKPSAIIDESYADIGTRTRDTFQIDLHHLRSSDIVVANLKGWNERSFGTAFEMGVAWSFGIPIVCIGGPKVGNPFVCESSMLVDDIEDALSLILNFE